MIFEKFMDETIMNFSDVCSVKTGVFKLASDVKSTVTENFSSAKSYITGWFGPKAHSHGPPETENNEQLLS